MSDLIIKGNVLSDLGAYLPTPYIQSVNVGIDKLTVKCSLYLNFLDKSEEEIGSIITDLQDLQVYVFYALGPEYSQRIIDKKAPNIFKEFAVGRSDYQQRQGTVNAGADSGIDIRRGGWDWSTVQINNVYANDITLADWESQWFSGTLGRYARKLEASNFQQIPFSSFTRGTTSFRDEEDNQIIEFSGDFEISVYAERYWAAGGAISDTNDKTYTLDKNSDNYLFGVNDGVDDSLTGLTLFAFSSFLDYNSADQADWTLEDGAYNVGGNTSATNPSAWAYTTVSDNIRRFNAIYPKLPNRLAVKQISNIAYENVFKDEEINREPQVFYVLASGANYHDTPVQVGSGTYYTQDGITLKEITTKFQELVDENQDTKDENLKNIIDNISFILLTYGESHNLLVKLGDLGRAFTSKSTATPVGKLYQRYKKRLSATTTAATAGNVLTKKLQRNLKIRDTRDLEPAAVPSPTEYTPPVEGQDWFQGSTSAEVASLNGGEVLVDRGTNSDYDLGSIIYTARDMNRRFQTAVDIYKTKIDGTSSDYFRATLEYGYFFVDQEKAIRYWSNIAKLFDVTKIENWFGKEITNLNFKFDWANITRKGGESNAKKQHVVEVYFDNSDNFPMPSIASLPDGPGARQRNKARTSLGAFYSEMETALTDWQSTTGTHTMGSGIDATQEAFDAAISWYENYFYGTPAIVSLRFDEGDSNQLSDSYTSWSTSDRNGDNNYFFSYIMPRNVTTLIPKSYSATGNALASDVDYRLMCFEYQFIKDLPYSSDSGMGAIEGGWPARFNYPGVGFIDNTFDIFRSMVLKYEDECINTTSHWQEYLNLANEPCNFNPATGMFNDFFDDSINTYFEDLPVLPWVIVPIIYYMHQDILHNTFDGDKGAVVAAAKVISDQINPKTGTMTAAQDFSQLVQQLYDDYYAVDTGEIRSIYTLYNGGYSEIGDDDHGGGRYYENIAIEFGCEAQGQQAGHNHSTHGYGQISSTTEGLHAWRGFPYGLDAVRVFIWDASDWQEWVENPDDPANDVSPDDPGIGIELGRSAIIT